MSLAVDPTDPARLVVSWTPLPVPATLRLERLERLDGDDMWQPVGEPDHVHVSAGEGTAGWHVEPGRYRASLWPDDREGTEPIRSGEVTVLGATSAGPP